MPGQDLFYVELCINVLLISGLSGHSLPCSIYTHTVLCSRTVTSFCRVQASGPLDNCCYLNQTKEGWCSFSYPKLIPWHCKSSHSIWPTAVLAVHVSSSVLETTPFTGKNTNCSFILADVYFLVIYQQIYRIFFLMKQYLLQNL